VQRLQRMSDDELQRRRSGAERALLTMGATFNVYGHEAGAEKILPFDIVPRVVEAADWARIERGLVQRIRALNLFIADCYGPQQILRDRVVPREVVESSKVFLPRCIGMKPPKGVWCHITGTDLVRGRDGTWMVLEDNLRCPSGVSYVLQNRAGDEAHASRTSSRPRGCARWTSTPRACAPCWSRCAPRAAGDPPTCVLLTPGSYNSAYFEHSFLAQQMGIELVEGRDLVVFDGAVHMRTTQGFQRVDVIYRRIDDTFLDPQVSAKTPCSACPVSSTPTCAATSPW
jgi:uncharacterized circularly permuted ATP-grasp superfamily protein